MFSIQMWPMIVQSRLHTAGGRPVVDVPYLLRHCKYTLLCIYLLLFRSYFFIKYISHQNPKLYCRCVLLFVPLHQLTFYCVTPFHWILFFYKSPSHIKIQNFNTQGLHSYRKYFTACLMYLSLQHWGVCLHVKQLSM